MAIEVEVTGNAGEPKREYPYLGRAECGTVVLFTSRSFGTEVSGNYNGLGYHGKGWQEHLFTPLSPSETVILRNKQ